jgi:hypothetical protein
MRKASGRHALTPSRGSKAFTMPWHRAPGMIKNSVQLTQLMLKQDLRRPAFGLCELPQQGEKLRPPVIRHGRPDHPGHGRP